MRGNVEVGVLVTPLDKALQLICVITFVPITQVVECKTFNFEVPSSSLGRRKSIIRARDTEVVYQTFNLAQVGSSPIALNSLQLLDFLPVLEVVHNFFAGRAGWFMHLICNQETIGSIPMAGLELKLNMKTA